MQTLQKFTALAAAVVAAGALSFSHAASAAPTRQEQKMTFPTGFNNFYKSDKVRIEKVRFKNPYGIEIAGNLVFPKNFGWRPKKYAARKNQAASKQRIV